MTADNSQTLELPQGRKAGEEQHHLARLRQDRMIPTPMGQAHLLGVVIDYPSGPHLAMANPTSAL
jgi:hypothetical protein